MNLVAMCTPSKDKHEHLTGWFAQQVRQLRKLVKDGAHAAGRRRAILLLASGDYGALCEDYGNWWPFQVRRGKHRPALFSSERIVSLSCLALFESISADSRSTEAGHSFTLHVALKRRRGTGKVCSRLVTIQARRNNPNECANEVMGANSRLSDVQFAVNVQRGELLLHFLRPHLWALSHLAHGQVVRPPSLIPVNHTTGLICDSAGRV